MISKEALAVQLQTLLIVSCSINVYPYTCRPSDCQSASVYNIMYINCGSFDTSTDKSSNPVTHGF